LSWVNGRREVKASEDRGVTVEIGVSQPMMTEKDVVGGYRPLGLGDMHGHAHPHIGRGDEDLGAIDRNRRGASHQRCRNATQGRGAQG
jgi:hypothetical protein